MTRRRTMQVFFAAVGVMVLIFDSRCALEGARAGMDLCIRTVIPSMFPFLVLSMMFTTSLGNVDGRFIHRLSGVMKIPVTAAPILIPAFLGGYPVGAKCVANLYNNGAIDKQHAERLLAFCSNAGPSFLFGMVSAFFPDRHMAWKLWLIHILGAVFTGILYPVTAKETENNRDLQTAVQKDDLMLSALKAMGIVCGWVVLFRTVTAFLKKWILWLLPPWLEAIIIGVLELSNGCCALLEIQNVDLRFIICSCILALGGVCVLFQTISVTKGLSLRNYYVGKFIQTLFSLLLSSAVVAKYGILCFTVAISIVVLLVKGKNKGGNLRMYPV